MVQSSRKRILHFTAVGNRGGTKSHMLSLIKGLHSRSEYDIYVAYLRRDSFYAKLADMNVPLFKVSMISKYDPTVIYRFAELLRREKIDILHTHGYKANIIGTIGALLAGNVHIIRTEHGNPEPFKGLSRLKMNLNRRADRLLADHFSDAVIAVSEDLRGKLLTRGYNHGKVTAINNGLDIEDFVSQDEKKNFKVELGIGSQDYTFGIVGRLEPVKGHEYFMRAAKAVIETQPNVKFLIVGDGSLSEQLKSISRQLCLDNYIRFCGFRGDALKIMSVLDTMVISSLDEGIPMVLLEALSLGKPVIASNVGGIPEVIEDGKTGFLSVPKDETDLAQKMIFVMENRPLASIVGQNAKAHVKKHFSTQGMAVEVSKIYSCLLDRR